MNDFPIILWKANWMDILKVKPQNPNTDWDVQNGYNRIVDK
jgi:hypothetical protein